jgi:hypothetical protein
MNTSTVSGRVQGKPELHVTKDGRRLLNFEIAVEGPGREPFCPCAYFLAPGESPTLEAGERVLVVGVLRHHRMRGLFVGASEARGAYLFAANPTAKCPMNIHDSFGTS